MTFSDPSTTIRHYSLFAQAHDRVTKALLTLSAAHAAMKINETAATATAFIRAKADHEQAERDLALVKKHLRGRLS